MHCLYPLQSSSDAIERRIIPLLVGRGIPFRGPILFWGMPPGDARRRRRSGRVTFPTPSPQNAHSQHIPSATSSVILSASKRKDPLLTLASAYPIKQSRCHIGTASPPPCGPAELPSPRADPFPAHCRRRTALEKRGTTLGTQAKSPPADCESGIATLRKSTNKSQRTKIVQPLNFERSASAQTMDKEIRSAWGFPT